MIFGVGFAGRENFVFVGVGEMLLPVWCGAFDLGASGDEAEPLMSSTLDGSVASAVSSLCYDEAPVRDVMVHIECLCLLWWCCMECRQRWCMRVFVSVMSIMVHMCLYVCSCHDVCVECVIMPVVAANSGGCTV